VGPDPVVGARLLVVDDEPANVLLLEELLGRWGVDEVVTTIESSTAVELCEAVRPHLVLLDLLMPPPDGFAVMESLGARGDGHGPPVLVLTGDISREARRRALELGARDFVTKPFDAVEVELRVRNLLAVRR
jgi:DNA-binding response OmpR family regulator